MIAAATRVTVSPDAMVRLTEIAVEAGRATLAHYHADVKVEQKGDKGPVTAADHAAHAVIGRALADWDPAIPVISEEAELPAFDTRRAWPRFWLVDPLDGTKEFIQRNGELTVNIALIDGGVPVLGVIYAPALDLLYYAGQGLGSWKREGGRAPARNPRKLIPPLAGALIKNEQDAHLLERLAFMTRRNRD